jgi:hypothetical protein
VGHRARASRCWTGCNRRSGSAAATR